MRLLLSPLFSIFWGASVGSFLNVCLYRWKNGGQVLFPPSFCPQCKKSIIPFDNIPVLSFVLLGGKCRHCHKSISFQYPLIESITAFFFWLSSFLFFKSSIWLVLASFVWVSFLILLGASDLKWRILPHVFNNVFILMGLVFSVNRPWSAPRMFFMPASSFLIVGSILFTAIQFFPQKLGGGDVKMIAGLGVWLGIFKTAEVLILACLLASAVFLALYCAGKISWKWKVPFGSFLAAGSLMVWFMPLFADQFRIIFARMS